MDRLYKRNFLITAGMILLSFLVLGGIFLALSYQYVMSDRTKTLQSDAEYVSDWMGYVMDMNYFATDESVEQTLTSVAQIADADVMIADTDGTILIYTDSEGNFQQDYAGLVITDSSLEEMDGEETYTGRSTLGIYEKRHFVAISPISMSSRGETSIVAYAVVTTSAAELSEMWENFIVIFIVVAIVVLILAMIMTYITSIRQTKPLEEMAVTVRRFGQGEYNLRVDDKGRKDEVGQLAKAFNAMADSIALQETRRQEFVANISHELKTPMTTITGFVDGILDGTIPQEKAADYLKIVSSETKRLNRLVRKMLDISKLQSPEYVTGHEKFDLCENMVQMLLSLEGKINSKGLNVDVQMPEHAVMVWGEPDAITQVGYNLMDNAIKFAYPNTVLGLSIITKDDKAYVSVTDHGPTIPPEELSLIFDRFHKSDKSRSLDKDGVGLGLYIVKTILNNHRESITVTSENDVTTFTFTMTLAK